MFKRVLVTTDGSELAEAVVPTALALEAPDQCVLRVVCVIEPGISYGSQPAEGGFFDNEFYRRVRQETEAHAQEAADRVANRIKDAGYECTTVLRNGPAAAEIIAEAKEWDADVVVTATHGRRGLSRALLGSVASEIVHSSPCPVLLYRSKKS